MTNPILKPIRLKSKKIRDSARMESCQIRLPGVCNQNPETTVFCHDEGGGTGNKVSDIFGAYGCSDCHDMVDGRVPNIFVECCLERFFTQGILRTQQILIDKGLIKI